MIASGTSDVQVAYQMGHSKVETTKNIYGYLFAWDRSVILDAMNQAIRRLHAYERPDDGDTDAAACPSPSPTVCGASCWARPSDLIEADRAAMLPLPAVPPPLGWCHQVRLGRDYYVREPLCCDRQIFTCALSPVSAQRMTRRGQL